MVARDSAQRMTKERAEACRKGAAAKIKKAPKIKDKRVEKLLQARAQARKKRDFAMADGLRDQLISMGYDVVDGAKGTSFCVSKTDKAGTINRRKQQAKQRTAAEIPVKTKGKRPAVKVVEEEQEEEEDEEEEDEEDED